MTRPTRPGLHEPRVEGREGRLEAGHAERRRLEGHLLLVPGVGRVVGGDGRDRPVAKRFDERLAILLGPKRWVHLQVRVEAPHRLVRQAEVVRRDLAGRRDAFGSRSRELLDGLAGREVEEVERPLFVAGEREVAADHDALGHGRVATEPELGRDVALVHVPAAGEGLLLAVKRKWPAVGEPVLERTAHERRRAHRLSVVREAHGPGLGELDHLGELLAGLRLRDRCEEPDGHLRVGSGPLG